MSKRKSNDDLGSKGKKKKQKKVTLMITVNDDDGGCFPYQYSPGMFHFFFKKKNATIWDKENAINKVSQK